MAKIDVIMPQMGESIAEGTLSRWIKKVGDAVKRDEPIFEISTDKVDAEIPAPAAGVLAEILVAEGQTVAVQTVVATIETEAGRGGGSPAPAAPPRRTTQPRRTAAAPAAPPSTPAAPPAPAPAPAPRPPAAAPTPAPRRGNFGRGGRAGPRAGRSRRGQRRRDRRGAAPPAVHAAGPEDGGGAQPRPERHPGHRARGPGHQERRAELPRGRARRPRPQEAPPGGRGRRGARRAAAVRARPRARRCEAWPGDRVEPWSRIRKLTAEHMVMSRRVSPHVNTIFEIDYTRVAQLRARKKQEYADRGVNLTYLAFIAKAVADGLRRHPVVNSAVSGESTVIRRDINLGIAVALDWGLIVPVIRHADELSLLGVARAINDLGERARTKKLSPDDVQRGTFTITNPGVFGSVIGTPIINQPQAAILCVGAIEKQPAVDHAWTAPTRWPSAPSGMLSLAFDHRIVDGADADRFMADVKAMLQEFPEGAV